MKKQHYLFLMIAILQLLFLSGCKKVSDTEVVSEIPIIEENPAADLPELATDSKDEESVQQEESEQQVLTQQEIDDLIQGSINGIPVELYWEDVYELHCPWFHPGTWSSPEESDTDLSADLSSYPPYLGITIGDKDYAGKLVSVSPAWESEHDVLYYRMGQVRFEVYADTLELIRFYQEESPENSAAEEMIDMNECARISNEIAFNWIDEIQLWDGRSENYPGTGWWSKSYQYLAGGIPTGRLEIRLSQTGQLLEISSRFVKQTNQMLRSEGGEAFIQRKVEFFTSEDALQFMLEKLIRIKEETNLMDFLLTSVPSSVEHQSDSAISFLIWIKDGTLALEGVLQTDQGDLLSFLLKEAQPSWNDDPSPEGITAYEISEDEYRTIWENSPFYASLPDDCPYEFLSWEEEPVFWRNDNSNPYYSISNYPRKETASCMFQGVQYDGTWMQSMYNPSICTRRDIYFFQTNNREGTFEINARTGELMGIDFLAYTPDPEKSITKEEALLIAKECFSLGERESYYRFSCQEINGSYSRPGGYEVSAQPYLEDIPLSSTIYCLIATDGMIFYFYQPKIDSDLWEEMEKEDALQRLKELSTYFTDHEEALIHQAQPYYLSYTGPESYGAYMLPDKRWVYMGTYTIEGLNFYGGSQIGLAEKLP